MAAVDLHVVGGADAGVVADGVVALAGAADSRLFALVDIFIRKQRGNVSV